MKTNLFRPVRTSATRHWDRAQYWVKVGNTMDISQNAHTWNSLDNWQEFQASVHKPQWQ